MKLQSPRREGGELGISLAKFVVASASGVGEGGELKGNGLLRISLFPGLLLLPSRSPVLLEKGTSRYQMSSPLFFFPH